MEESNLRVRKPPYPNGDTIAISGENADVTQGINLTTSGNANMTPGGTSNISPGGVTGFKGSSEECLLKRKLGDSDFVEDRGKNEEEIAAKKAEEREVKKKDRDSLVLWGRPRTTLYYALLETIILLKSLPSKWREYKLIVSLFLFLALLLVVLNKAAGRHQEVLQLLQQKCMWCFYWFGLGVLSSIGLGTGLHTFLLYLGPHIASVTLAAYECGGLNFPEPPYPDVIKCPVRVDPMWEVSLWNIMCKVYVEAMCWGAGTAVGELPPYFMARAARLSGYDPDDEDDLREFEEFQKRVEEHPETLSYIDRLKVVIEKMVEKAGFFGILACASYSLLNTPRAVKPIDNATWQINMQYCEDLIRGCLQWKEKSGFIDKIPNPLFDLAGVTCGHFLVPFWTFFGATLIGKAVVKMMIQKMFVIIAFNEALIAKAVQSLTVIPIIGSLLQQPVTQFFANQKKRLHGKGTQGSEGNLIGKLFEVFVILMILYFVLSIINSFAQSYHKRLQKIKAQKDLKN